MNMVQGGRDRNEKCTVYPEDAEPLELKTCI